MFDFGWQEFMMIAFVLVLVVGPKDLPKVLRGVSKITGQARQMAREQQVSEFGLTIRCPTMIGLFASQVVELDALPRCRSAF